MRADREELRHRPTPRDRSVNTRAADVTAEGESTADGGRPAEPIGTRVSPSVSEDKAYLSK